MSVSMQTTPFKNDSVPGFVRSSIIGAVSYKDETATSWE
jgi:hypothetical protein